MSTVGARVYVYRNLNVGAFSVAAIKGRIGRGKVVDHVPTLLLTGCTFHVQAGGRERVRSRGQREVHAGVVGVIDTTAVRPAGVSAWREVTYNPYVHDCFVYVDTGAPCESAPVAWFESNKVFVQ